jgi:glycosyltransferase involved in cell wall biosynthesis
MNEIPVTIIIPVKNEEINLPLCLEPLKNFSQIIVVDSGSTDRTPEIAIEYNVEYINFIWNGQFPKKRNWALQNLKIINSWVLFLDADEFLNNKFINELIMKIDKSIYSGFWITYENYFMGRKLKFGDKMHKLPIFKVKAGEYERINEDHWSDLDMEIHEHPIIKGKIGTISTPIVHKDYKGLEQYLRRHNDYSSWEAHRYLTYKDNQLLTFRQNIKYKLINTSLLSYIYFVYSYFFKLGFLDGKAGYYFARFKSNYFLQIRCKIFELTKS